MGKHNKSFDKFRNLDKLLTLCQLLTNHKLISL